MKKMIVFGDVIGCDGSLQVQTYAWILLLVSLVLQGGRARFVAPTSSKIYSLASSLALDELLA